MDTGRALRRLQQERVVANVDIASALGIHPQTVCRWRDYKDLKVSKCQKLASFFGLTLEEFLAYGLLED
jgi:hypothetical protein